jgi:hypothetical protein
LGRQHLTPDSAHHTVPNHPQPAEKAPAGSWLVNVKRKRRWNTQNQKIAHKNNKQTAC